MAIKDLAQSLRADSTHEMVSIVTVGHILSTQTRTDTWQAHPNSWLMPLLRMTSAQSVRHPRGDVSVDKGIGGPSSYMMTQMSATLVSGEFTSLLSSTGSSHTCGILAYMQAEYSDTYNK